MTVRQPPFSIEGGLIRNVESELEWLLARARAGELVGIAWVAHNKRGHAEAGAAGNYARDELRASGALFKAAIVAGN